MGATLWLFLAAAAPPGDFPRAAAFVRDGAVVVVDSKSGAETRHEFPGLLVNGAALHPRRTHLAVTAASTEGGTSRLFIKELKSGTLSEANTALTTDHFAPAFAPDGARVLFTAAEGVPAGPEHPTRLRSWNLKAHRLERLPGGERAGVCQFGPAPGPKETHYVETDCLSSFSLQSTSRKSTPLRLPAADVEVASSFDGSRVVYVQRGVAGLAVMLRRGTEEPKLLVMLEAAEERLQPRFVCPRDLLVVHAGQVKSINTDTGEVTSLAAVSQGGEGAK